MLSHNNVGTGVDYTIKELVETVSKFVGFVGEVKFDPTKPDGAPSKLMNVDRLSSLGWQYSISLENWLTMNYKWFVDDQS
jgi:GDP-L-fucose synthase